MLLSTKLSAPHIRPASVARTRLVQQLNQELHAGCKLVLVSAPAGFGKTTLISEWACRNGRPMAWVSLDQGDNDLVRFWSYVVAAFTRLDPSLDENILPLLQPSQAVPVESFLTSLINALSSTSDSNVLVLDDYHLIESQAVHQSVAFFLEHLPSQFHIVITSRMDPPLPLSKLRGRGEVKELRASDLRFTLEETAAFLSDVMNLHLKEDDISALESRTEGWVAGLQLAALSMKGIDDPGELSSFVESFTGSHRHIVDYLAEEVLQRQPEDIQSFLLQTSILGRLTGPLCDAITRQPNSQAVLERLERDNLFLVPLDHERRWYRYHHLFADLLQMRLKQSHPGLEPELHRRAATWYEDNGLTIQAVNHALAAKDVERVASLVMANAQSTLARGEIATVEMWLNALPEEIVLANPRLCVDKARVLYLTNQLSAVEPLLDRAEERLGSHSQESKDGRWLSGEVLTLRAYLAREAGEHHRAIQYSRKALEVIHKDQSWVRGECLDMLGWNLLIVGESREAKQVLTQAIQVLKAARNVYGATLAISQMSLLMTLLGELRSAESILQDSFAWVNEQAASRMPATIALHNFAGYVLCEQNRLEEAESHLNTGLELGKNGRPLYSVNACMFLARVKQAQGDIEGALKAMDRAERIVRNWETPLAASVFPTRRARLWLSRNNLSAAVQWMEQSSQGMLKPDEIPTYFRELELITIARVLIAQGREQPDGPYISQAIELLERIRKIAESAGRHGIVLETLVLEAVVRWEQREVALALDALDNALAIAEPEGYVRIFLDEGKPMAALLEKIRPHHPCHAFAMSLLAAFKEEPYWNAPSASASTLSESLRGPSNEVLSEREVEVLRLVATGLSNKQVADKLFLTVGTVKWHINQIMSKLNARSRTEAVARARELQLL